MNELELLLATWDRESRKTVDLLRALPLDQYDFRPDPAGRSLGELAWHMAEAEAYITFAIASGSFAQGGRPPGIERPKTVAALADGFDRIRRDAMDRVRELSATDRERTLPFINGPTSVRDLLWEMVLLHNVHHRGQLMTLCRMAGGTPPAVYGPTREQTPVKA
jgi:uncharacterized damage-inducible protein DinB